MSKNKLNKKLYEYLIRLPESDKKFTMRGHTIINTKLKSKK